MSFSAKENPQEITDEHTPFSRAKGFAAYCRSSAFDQSDGPMLAFEFEVLAHALSKRVDTTPSDGERANLAKSVQDAAVSLGSTDEWTDHHSMIGDFEDRFSALKNERDESRLANTDLAEQLEKAEAEINRMMGSATAARKDFDETFTRMQAAEQRAMSYADAARVIREQEAEIAKLNKALSVALEALEDKIDAAEPSEIDDIIGNAIGHCGYFMEGPVKQKVMLTARCVRVALTNAGLLASSPAYAIDAMRPASDGLSKAARDVLAERQRQISVKGWTPDHDDGRANSEIILEPWGAARRICRAVDYLRAGNPVGRMMLVEGAALILAEIERLDRAAPTPPAQKEGKP